MNTTSGRRFFIYIRGSYAHSDDSTSSAWFMDSTVCGDMRASASAQPTCTPSVVSTSISPPVWLVRMPMLHVDDADYAGFRAITGAERNASNVSSGNSPKNLNRGSR